jgi:hypothetical protein
MNVLRNFEAIFVAATVITTFAAYASAHVPAIHTAQVSPTAVVAEGKMSVVVVKAKRLTPAQKAAAI